MTERGVRGIKSFDRSQYSLVSLRCLNYLFALFKLLFRVHRAVFNDTSIVFHDTSMILLSAFFEKSHWL